MSNNITEIQSQIESLENQLRETKERLLLQQVIDNIKPKPININHLCDVELYKLACIQPNDSYMLRFNLNGKEIKINFEINPFSGLKERVGQLVADEICKEIGKMIKVIE